MYHLIYIAFALVLIGVGLVMFPLPIPLGAPMIAAGITILLSHSRLAAKAMMRLRLHNPRFNRAVYALEDRVPRRVARILMRTRPEWLREFGIARHRLG